MRLCLSPPLSLLQSFPLFCFLSIYLHSLLTLLHFLSFSISLTPRLRKAYKSHGDRLAPLGMPQPEAWRKGTAHQICLLFVLKPRHAGIFT